VAPLRPALHGHTTLLIGQSGMGKSTLINALFPDADVVTAEYSEALDSGRHTTTHTRLHRLDADSAVIDSPGLQEFALQHLDAARWRAPSSISARFWGSAASATASTRPNRAAGCRKLSAAGEIDPARLKLFQTLRRLQQNAAQRL
jgi:ribosome biogenesis GTPase / thiamine phosphate phosphatase